jgi:hypothetical protein
MSQAAVTKISLRAHEELALFRLRRAGRRDPASIVAVDELPIGAARLNHPAVHRGIRPKIWRRTLQ